MLLGWEAGESPVILMYRNMLATDKWHLLNGFAVYLLGGGGFGGLLFFFMVPTQVVSSLVLDWY